MQGTCPLPPPHAFSGPGLGPGCTDVGTQECGGGGGNSQPQLRPGVSGCLFLRPELSISGLGVRMGWGWGWGVLKPEGEKTKLTHGVWPFPSSHPAPSPSAAVSTRLRGTLLCRLGHSRKCLLSMFKLAAPKVPSACHTYTPSTFSVQMGKLRLQGVLKKVTQGHMTRKMHTWIQTPISLTGTVTWSFSGCPRRLSSLRSQYVWSLQ